MWEYLPELYERLPPRYFGTLITYRYRGLNTPWLAIWNEPGVRLVRIGETNLVWTRPSTYRARLAAFHARLARARNTPTVPA
jgi:hypothetical protein